MRFLAGMKIFKEVEQGSFLSTPLAGAYVSASPLSSAVIHMCVTSLSPKSLLR
jgi:hypothetical protein